MGGGQRALGAAVDPEGPMLQYGDPRGGQAQTRYPQPSIEMNYFGDDQQREQFEINRDLDMKLKVRVINDLLKGKINQEDWNKGEQYKGEKAWPSSQEFNPVADAMRRLLGA